MKLHYLEAATLFGFVIKFSHVVGKKIEGLQRCRSRTLGLPVWGTGGPSWASGLDSAI